MLEDVGLVDEALVVGVEQEVAGAFINLEPLVGATLGAFMFGDPFGSAQLVGTIALVVGIALSAFPERVAREPAACG